MSSPPVKRGYDSSHRREKALANRRAMIDAARERFLSDGYPSTTLAEVAEAAGVSLPTVYKVFGTKAGLLKAVFDVAVAGDDEPVPIADRDEIHAVIDEPDPKRKIALFMDHLARSMRRSGPIQLLARDAAAADPEAAAVWDQMQAETLSAMGQFAADLDRTGALAVSRREARDVLWTCMAPELWGRLVLERGWSAARYAGFLTTTATANLLG